MSHYQQSIAERLGITDPATLALVEELMRDEYSTLDHLDRSAFARAARKAYSEALAMAGETIELDGEQVNALAFYCRQLDLALPTLGSACSR